MEEKTVNMPAVPMRGVVLFPHMVLNFDAARKKSIKALEYAMEHDNMVFLTTQTDITKDEPSKTDVFETGTVARVKQMMRMPGGVMRVIVQGEKRGYAVIINDDSEFMSAQVLEYDDTVTDETIEDEAYRRRVVSAYEEYFAENPKLNADSFMRIMAVKKLSELCDIISAELEFKVETKQMLLEEFDAKKRAEKLIVAIENQLQVLKIERKIANKVKNQIDKNQREYYLREQLKAIQDELNEDEGIKSEAEEYEKKIKKLKAPKSTKDKLLKETGRFRKMQVSSAESAVIRSYLDTVLDLPWNKQTKENFDLNNARKILDDEHYGLEKVKERVTEYLAVRQLTGGKNGTILCLSGPPGVGKTSVAKSIAHALDRKYVRISLGGIHDESDIRGHRKTYIGAMEGRIMRQAQKILLYCLTR